MMRDREEEMEAIRKRSVEAEKAIDDTLREAENVSRCITAEALSQLGDSTPQRAHDFDETATVKEGLSPKQIVEFDEWNVDTQAREIHEAQVAAARDLDGDASSSASASDPKVRVPQIPHRGGGKNKQHKVLAAPMDTVLEDTLPSDAGSYRSIEEPEQDALEQAEGPPVDE
eukprot:1574087-Amphidinium_carterae.1